MAGLLLLALLGLAAAVPSAASAAPPLPTIDPVTPAGPNSATLSGSVDPNGSGTKYHFEYREQGAAQWRATPIHEAGSGSGAVPVSAELPLLNAATTYEAQLTASSEEGTETSSPVSFETPTGPPAVQVLPGSGRTSSEARLNGTINPNGLVTRYRFEWGTSSAYGNSIPVSGEAYAGLGQSLSRYSKLISGLAPNTTIHYRIVAANGAGETVSPDQTVTTLAQEVRYEMASPPNKNGSNLLFCCRAHAAPSGNQVQYVSPGVFAGGTSSLLFNTYLSTREADNWGTQFLPLTQTTTNGGFVNGSTQGSSPDLSHVFQFSHDALLPGAVPGNSNMYWHDLKTGELRFVATFEDEGFGMGISDAGIFMGATPDGSHMYFRSPVPLLPGAVPGTIYDYSGGALHLASVLPDGSATAAEDLGTGRKDRLKYNSVTPDGSRFFFTAESGIYMREGGTTTRISASQRTGHDPAKEPIVSSSYASEDGSTVYFVVFGGNTNEPLTDDAPPFFGEGTGQLYRYDVGSGKLTYISPDGEGGPSDTNFVQWVIGVSADGSTVYFNGGHADGTSSSFTLTANRFYVAQDGAARFIAETPSEFGRAVEGGETSPDGRYFAFVSNYPGIVSPPADSCEGCEQVYVYDTHSGLTCASCNPAGTYTPAIPFGWLEPEENTGGYIPRFVINGGVFFESESQLVPEDTNDNIDVYRWKDGQLDLISRGYGKENSFLGDATPDGSSVFFYTGEKLVSQDVDDAQDLYVARVGGGLAGQNPAGPEPPCAGEGCLNRTPEPPGDVTPGTNGFSGPVNPRASFGRKARCAKQRQTKSRGGKRQRAKQSCTAQHRHQAKKKRHNSKQGGSK